MLLYFVLYIYLAIIPVLSPIKHHHRALNHPRLEDSPHCRVTWRAEGDRVDELAV